MYAPVKMLLLPVGVLLLALSCKSGQKPGGGGDVSVREVASGLNSGITEPREVMITSADAWTALWQEVGSRRTPAPEMPAVDFSKEVVIACFSGAKSTGGHGIKVEKITRKEGEYQVFVTRTSPGKGCMVTEAFTYPYAIVAVPGTGGVKAVFTVQDQTRDCP